MLIGPNTVDRNVKDAKEPESKTVLTEEEATTYPTGRGKFKNGFGKADGQSGLGAGTVRW